ncbi:hypothetical protein BDV12DRAFT_172569 [Aspergillus spectabilis]
MKSRGAISSLLSHSVRATTVPSAVPFFVRRRCQRRYNPAPSKITATGMTTPMAVFVLCLRLAEGTERHTDVELRSG